VEVSSEERDLLLAALFEPRLTRSAFDHDPEAERTFARISYDAIMALVAKLGGEPDTALFGAYRDRFADDDVSVPEYPADETNEG
jgi:hypothetical protein